MVMALPFSTLRKHCPDDYSFIVPYQRIVKAQHSRFHVCDSYLGPAHPDFAVYRLHLTSFGISPVLTVGRFIANPIHLSSVSSEPLVFFLSVIMI